jgi:hypothetical protein
MSWQCNRADAVSHLSMPAPNEAVGLGIKGSISAELIEIYQFFQVLS